MNLRSAKVFRVGHTSLAVVIPKDWTRGMEVEAGDTVEIFYDGRDVTIRKPEAGAD